MKFVCFQFERDNYWGSLREDRVDALGRIARESPQAVNHAIGRLHGGAVRSEAMPLSLDQVQLIAPVPAPGKIICVGRNYSDHAAEMGASVGELPVIFNKLPTCVIGPGEPVRLPDASSSVDYEAELVAVIGRAAHNVPEESAESHVYGYCCGNDVTARDWQKNGPGGQWLLGKSFDTFAPIGPWIVPRDELNASSLDIRMRLNDTVMQSANTRQLVFPLAKIIAHLSRFCTLLPGDLIFTGSPSGVGAGREPPVWLKCGDHMSVEIEGIGTLENPVIASGANDDQQC